MSIAQNKKAKKENISRETIAAIKYHCFNNMKEFYNRYKGYLKMSQPTLYKIMEGDYVSKEYIDNLNRLMELLGTKTDGLVKTTIIQKFVGYVEAFVQSQNMSDFNNMRDFLEAYRYAILSENTGSKCDGD